jgi:hypothetical protein
MDGWFALLEIGLALWLAKQTAAERAIDELHTLAH